MADNSAAPIDNLSDDQLLATFAGKGGASAPPIDAMSDDDLLKAFASTAKTADMPLPAQTGNWGALSNFASSVDLGAGPMIKAAANAAKETAGEISRGVPIGSAITDFKDYYNQAKSIYDAEKAQYAKDHPIAAPVTQIAGNIVGTTPLMMGAGALANAGGAALTRAAPALEPVVDFVSGAATGNRLLKYGSQAVNGALQGGLSSLISAGDSDQPIGEQVKQGALAGSVAAPLLGAAADVYHGVANKLTGGGVNPETAKLADAAINKFDIPIRGGQISNSPIVNYADSALTALPFTGYAGKQEAARDAFTQAVSRTFGEDTPAITQDVMQNAKTRIGKMFDDVAANTALKADPSFVTTLAKVESDAGQVLSSSEMAPIKTQLDNIIGKVDANGEISGDVYQAITRKGAPLDRAMSSSDPNVKFYAGQIRGALDDALERSASPDTLATLQSARSQYKNMKTIEDLAEKSPDGRISPALLLGQVRKSFGNYAYQGGGDLGELAQIGQRFLKEPPNSGTATRNLIHAGLAGAGTLGETALFLHDPTTAGIAAGVAGSSALAGMGLGKLLDNQFYRNALLRQASGTPAVTAAPSIARQYAPAAAGIIYNRLIPASP